MKPLALLAAALLCLVPAAASAQACVEGTITSEIQVGGPFDGLYKYTVEITWDTPRGLSHATLDCGFGTCADAACAESWSFGDPAGTGTGGDPDDCAFEFEGEFNCQGDPSVSGYDFPVIKWDAVDTDDCEAGKTGSATLCFYTSVAPVPGLLPVVLVKNGQNQCEGTIVGDCPLPCPVGVESATWGGVKSLLDLE